MSKIKVLRLFLVCVSFSCSQEKENVLSGGDGYCWDVMYDNNSYRMEPAYGYCFRSDGQYYAYHYYGEVRTPFDVDLADASTPPTINANLRPWRFLSDTTIQIGSRKYTVEYLKEDTISLKMGVAKNPIVKLVRVKER